MTRSAAQGFVTRVERDEQFAAEHDALRDDPRAQATRCHRCRPGTGRGSRRSELQSRYVVTAAAIVAAMGDVGETINE